MQKAYSRQNFHNGTDPALDEVDMNKIDQGLDVVDDRVIELDMTTRRMYYHASPESHTRSALE